MTELIDYYDRELEYFQRFSLEFAKRFPKIAARLGIDDKGIRDPSADHIVQGVSLLNARLRKKLDDDFPEIIDALFDIIYPDFLKPVPSITLVQFTLDPNQVPAAVPLLIPAKTSTLMAGGGNQEELFYTTSYDVELWPIDITSIQYRTRAFEVPKYTFSRSIESMLELKLRTSGVEQPFNAMAPDELVFCINISQISSAGKLYELLFQHLAGITLSNPDKPDQHQSLDLKNLLPVGLELDENLLPQSPRSFTGYRLLTEYFTFPRKYLFFKLKGLQEFTESLGSNKLDLRFYFSQIDQDLEQRVRNDSILLGCTPAINLFPANASEIQISPQAKEYRIIPETSNEYSQEIYHVNKVEKIDSSGKVQEIFPLYGSRPGVKTDSSMYWHLRRTEVETTSDERSLSGYEYFMSLVDFNHGPLSLEQAGLQVSLTCFNRDLPNRFAEFDLRPQFKLLDQKSVITNVLITPTPTRRRTRGEKVYWQLLSQLSMNYKSLMNQGNPEHLQHILELNDPIAGRDTIEQIRGIMRLDYEPGITYLDQTLGGFCRGLHIRMDLDELKFAGTSSYLFATVLNEFLNLYVRINSFTQFSVTTSKMQTKGLLWKWPPKAGGKNLQ